MNILIVSPIFPPRTGGPATYTWKLAKRFKNKHNIKIICFSPKPKSLVGIEIINISEKVSFFSRQTSLLKAVLNKAKWADMVYVQGPLVVGFTSAIAAKIKGKKVYLKFVGDEVWENARIKKETKLALTEYYKSNIGAINSIKKLLEKISFYLSDRIIVPSSFLKHFINSNFQVPSEKISVIPNAVDLNIKQYKKKTDQLIFVGRLVPWKNIDQIILAVQEAKKKYPWKLIIIGEGPEENILKMFVRTIKAEKWVSFLGRLSHKKTLKQISESKKLILYSSYEGLSHTAIESMLLKTQVIASDIPGNREVLDKFGLFVSLNDISELTEAINRPAKDLIKAQQYAINNYHWQKHIRKLEKNIL
jgi:glycosyltransferase involved in cell wall biosynthesis